MIDKQNRFHLCNLGLFEFYPMKHGRGTRGAAPTSDAAGRGDMPGTPRRATWIPHAFSRLAPTWLRLGPICVESGQLRPIQAEIQKKKKKVQNAPFDLYLNPTSAQFHTNTKT